MELNGTEQHDKIHINTIKNRFIKIISKMNNMSDKDET